jgi:hypothetical protein
MHPLIEMANHLLAAALAEADQPGALRVRTCRLDETGLRVSAWIDHPRAFGEVVLALRVDPPAGPHGLRQTLRLTVERWPDRLPPVLQALRGVLEKARFTLELDFAP